MAPFIAILIAALLTIVIRHRVVARWRAGAIPTPLAAVLLALPLPAAPIVASVLGAALSPLLATAAALLLFIPGVAVAQILLQSGMVGRTRNGNDEPT